MLSKNLILLAVIGLAIYFLTKPVNSNPIKNSGTLEENASISKSETNPDSEELQQAITNSSEDKETSGIVTEVEQELEGKAESEASGTHSFKPTETDGGANLNAAFEKPIPDGIKTNSVDFNKNYLKKYDSKNYLPQEVNDEWFDTDFTQAKNKLNNDNLINTDKYIIGVDTVGQSLKNASHDIRGTIANPKYNVSPWNNSTYEPDYNLKSLC
jgi:hypothetical protein